MAGDAAPIDAKFRSHLKCPYAAKWLSKGPEQAALELGLHAKHYRRRELQQDVPPHLLQLLPSQLPVKGSCQFFNLFSGDTRCMQFHGLWKDSDMASRCAQEKGSTLSVGQGCTIHDESAAAGWCSKVLSDEKQENTMMQIIPTVDCNGNQLMCEQFMEGKFIASSVCSAPHASAGGGGKRLAHHASVTTLASIY